MQIARFCMAPFPLFKSYRFYWTSGAPGEIRTPDPQIRSLRSGDDLVLARLPEAPSEGFAWQHPAGLTSLRHLAPVHRGKPRYDDEWACAMLHVHSKMAAAP